MRKMLLAFCLACLCVLFGCSQGAAAQQASSTASDSSSAAQGQSDAADASGSAKAEASSSSDEEMPDYDFGFDESEYLVKTYGLENAERLDLVNSDQVAWLALNRIKAAVVIADPEGKTSKSMIALAQESANKVGDTAAIHVFEPQREAEDKNWDKLAEKLVDAGVANLEDISPEKTIFLNKRTIDENGGPAPVTDVITDAKDVQEAVERKFAFSCCVV